MRCDNDFFLVCLFSVVMGVCAIAAYCLEGKPEARKNTPITEIRCSDLERVYEECESAPDVAICRGRYTIKIANCFGG